MILFISDLHLSPRSPGATALFLRFLADRARQAQARDIRGDLFEAWIGDDDIDDPYHARIVTALRATADAGVQISLMHGNRDFLLGQKFADAAGLRLLADPYDLTLPEWSFVLSHGDALCLDDTAYQEFRTRVRAPEWQEKMLARPRFVRRLVARYFRWRSRNTARAVYADLNPSATDDFLRDHGYVTFIHGHTHQPATHDHIVDGIHVERWVLADWHEDRGEALVWDGEMLKREAIVFENRP
ncbi:MAG: UDP-2,3-diacylglucosamine diphosphatase [Dechloromonas sp.]|nr:UDP-2,3-diacylglucosamine diphosphatase [Dechloromonas sp.]